MNVITIDQDSQPLEVFEAWMKDAKAQPRIREATAMAISTIDARGDIHSRMVLCKEWSEAGFIFYTNYNSRKGQALELNNHAAAVFYWDPLNKQVNISGTVTKTSRQVSEKYWASRLRDSQISQYISHQSQPVTSRDEMEATWRETDERFKNEPIPCPEHWGGYILSPARIEFWVGQSGRLHDRYEFQKSQNHWTFRRLYP